ncbi:MAG: hypothetical protein Q9169_008580, partial [Polycauliona sp. 2 TL-2023]
IDAHLPQDPHRITILGINRKVTLMLLATYLKPHEERFYADCMTHFRQIVSLASFILRQTPQMPRRAMRIVHRKQHEIGDTPGSFFAGLIQPLYFTAIKCRERVTALKAVDLLEGEPWREGTWDSAVMAKVARGKMEELEEEGWYDAEYHGRPADGMEEREYGRDTELSFEWPLATDPYIAYP